VDELLDYLIDRNRAGYAMVNCTEHLRNMKSLLRGGVAPWPCRAGRNMVVCRDVRRVARELSAQTVRRLRGRHTPA
jgi:hypothetical protein